MQIYSWLHTWYHKNKTTLLFAYKMPAIYGQNVHPSGQNARSLVSCPIIVIRFELNYRQTSIIRRNKSQNLNIFLPSWSFRCSNPLNPGVKSRMNWSSADRRWSNYVWMINNFISYWDATYIKELTVLWIITRILFKIKLDIIAIYLN